MTSYADGERHGRSDIEHSHSVSKEPASFSPEVRSLTGLRGVAACWVVVYHVLASRGGDTPIEMLVVHGYIAVDLFFCLSGFVMAMTAANAFKQSATLGTYVEFIWRRIARIWPLYAALTGVIVVAKVVMGARPFNLSYASDVAANLALIQNWGLAPSVIASGWSLSVEMLAYLLFPLLLEVTVFARARTAIVALVATTGLFAALVLLPPAWTHITSYRGPLDIVDYNSYGPVARCLLEFLFGLLAWRSLRCARLSEFLGASLVSLALWLSILGLLAIRNTDVWVVILFSPLIVSLMNKKSLPSRIIASNGLHWLGLISYSLYLSHIFCGGLFEIVELRLRGFMGEYATAAALVSTVAASICLAALCHYFIEKPLRTLFRTRASARPLRGRLPTPT